jgi:methionyl-tRNA formyltransferase
VATGEGGAVKLAEVQPPGKRRMEASAWIRGAGPGAGERFR